MARKKTNRRGKVTVGVTPGELDRLVSRFASDPERLAARLALTWALIRLNGPTEEIERLLESVIPPDSKWQRARVFGAEALKAIVYSALGTVLFEVFSRWQLSSAPQADQAETNAIRPEDRATLLLQRVRNRFTERVEHHTSFKTLQHDLAGALAARTQMPVADLMAQFEYGQDLVRVQDTLSTLANLKVIDTPHEAFRVDYAGAPLGTLSVVTAAGSRRVDPANRVATANLLRSEISRLGLNPDQWAVDLSGLVPISYDEANSIHETFI